MPNNVQIKLTAYRNCDDVQLFWRTTVNGKEDAPIPGALGFVIERQRKNGSGGFGPSEILRNRVGFKDGNASAASKNGNKANKKNGNKVANKKDGTDATNEQDQFLSEPSNIWPFQEYTWTDHGANSGQVVKYRVSAVSLPAGANIGISELQPIAYSEWSDEITVTAECDNKFSAYFNRGFVMSQFVARVARDNGWGPKDVKDHIKDLQEPLRRFMSGELRIGLLNLTNEVIEDMNLELYAALFELADDELIEQLKHLRGRAHIVLANGADKSGDENKTARNAIKKAGVEVKDRLLGSKGLGHNKFAVVVNKKTKQPLKVWTGSTNWAPTGLCTQVNNGILIDDPSIAKIYIDHWHDLVDAKSEFTPDLISKNALSPRSADHIDVWFTPIRKKSTKNVGLGKDLNELVDLVKGTKEALFYVMFQPGQEPLKTIIDLANTKLVKGVVSTLSSSVEESFALHNSAEGMQQFKSRLVVPQGIPVTFSYWLQEVTRNVFLKQIGFAITHSKMIVIDPLSDNCTVITGSHNFSGAASEKNDENFVVIKGNKKLCEAYSVACLATYAHYRWRAFVMDKVKAKEKIWSHLTFNDSWQNVVLSADLKKSLAYWCK